MNERDQLFAYLATLGALVIIFLAALVVAAISPGIIQQFESFGLGTIAGGLIGALRAPARQDKP